MNALLLPRLKPAERLAPATALWLLGAVLLAQLLASLPLRSRGQCC